MKHGRRHKTLKEQTYAARYKQDAPGYRRAVEPIDVREPDAPATLPEPTSPIGARVKGKTKHALRRLGVDEPERE